MPCQGRLFLHTAADSAQGMCLTRQQRVAVLAAPAALEEDVLHEMSFSTEVKTLQQPHLSFGIDPGKKGMYFLGITSYNTIIGAKTKKVLKYSTPRPSHAACIQHISGGSDAPLLQHKEEKVHQAVYCLSLGC